MRGFFKTFFAALLALVAFSIVVLFVIFTFIGGILSPAKPDVGGKAVLVVDLGQAYKERGVDNPLANFDGEDEYDVPGVYDMVRLIHHARSDSAIKGIYLKCNNDPNGFATNEEIRLAIAWSDAEDQFELQLAGA